VNVSLTPELEKFIDDRVASGQYRSASEVVRESLRLLQEREQRREAKLVALRAAIDEGIASLDRGEGISGDEALVYLRRRRATLNRQ
jgi:antitoxin ParD1/3/4